LSKAGKAMIFATHLPSPPLNQFIECFIYHEGFNPPHLIDRLLPDGNVEIIIDLLDRPQFIYDNESLAEIQACRRVWASGLRSKPITIPSGKNTEMLIISFKKGMAFPFFNMPMNELVDTVVDADLIWGQDFAELRELILGAQEVVDKFLCVENFLLNKYRAKLISNSCVDFALKTIINHPYQLSLASLNQQIGYSQKHFISLFTKQVGIPPKQFLKIMRFQKIIHEIEQYDEIDWSAISLNCGFYDQAHFVNDFKIFSGFRPTDYLHRKQDMLNYVPVG
jgi:AraC-like DNA-binding protein